MNEFSAVTLYVFSGFMAAISQLILKKVAVMFGRKNGYKKYLDWRIILSYALLLSTIFLNMIALRFMPYKNSPVLSSLSYVFVLILGRLVLHEKMTWTQFLGVIIIFIGMGVFYIG